MSDGEILVNHEAMNSGQDSLGRAHQQTIEHLENLDGKIRALFESFSGESQTAYATAHGKWTNLMGEMGTALASSRQLLGDSHQAMIDADMNGAKGIEGV